MAVFAHEAHHLMRGCRFFKLKTETENKPVYRETICWRKSAPRTAALWKETQRKEVFNLHKQTDVIKYPRCYIICVQMQKKDFKET